MLQAKRRRKCICSSTLHPLNTCLLILVQVVCILGSTVVRMIVTIDYPYLLSTYRYPYFVVINRIYRILLRFNRTRRELSSPRHAALESYSWSGMLLRGFDDLARLFRPAYWPSRAAIRPSGQSSLMIFPTSFTQLELHQAAGLLAFSTQLPRPRPQLLTL